MSIEKAPLVQVDWTTFDPWRVQQVRHRLCDHPLLQMDQLIGLGKRLEVVGETVSFNSDVTADADFDTASRTHPNPQKAAPTLRDIANAKAWMLLRHVQADPVYCGLVDSVLDEIKPQIERNDPGMCFRAGWIFVQSPHTVTPFHIDKNHVLVLQVRGEKTLYVWDADDVEVVSDRARDRFHTNHQLDLAPWNETFRARAHVFHLRAGDGVYMPLTSPHMAEMGDEPSVAISFSYNTDASRRNTSLHRLRERTRRSGIKLPPVARHSALDAACYAGVRALGSIKSFSRGLFGRSSHSDGEPYAPAD